MSKKIVLALALISLFIGASSCQKEIVESVDDNNDLISFKAVLGKPSTKATEFKYWANGGGFTVHSYYSSSLELFKTFALIYNSSGNSWSYEGSFNQPGVPLRYYAVNPEPAASDAQNITSGGQWSTLTKTDKPFTYIVGASGNPSTAGADKQEDLIATYINTLDSNIELQFKHLLSQVNFAIQGMLGVEIIVSNIKLNGITNNGVYNFSANSNAGGWSAAESPATADYPYYPLTGAGSPSDSLAKGLTNKVVYLGNAPYNYYNKANALMLMPQSFAKDAQSKPTLTFGFSLRPDSNGDGVINSSDDAAKTGSITVDLCDFETTTWLSGKRYVYLIDFTSYLAGGPITFKVTVDDWKNDEDNTTIETVQVTKADQESIENAAAALSALNAENTSLKTFTINVTERPTSPIALTKILGFDKDDVIYVEFPATVKADDEAELKDLFFSVVPGWTLEAIAEGSRVAKLTCTTPNTNANLFAGIKKAEEANLSSLMLAIHEQGLANQASTANKYFTVHFNAAELGESETIKIPVIINFEEGDQIFIVCKTEADAKKIQAPTIWGNPVVNGNIVTLTCTSNAVSKVITTNPINISGDYATLSNLMDIFEAREIQPSYILPITITAPFMDDVVNIPVLLNILQYENAIIYITCKDETEAAKISCTAYNWDSVQFGNIVVLSWKAMFKYVHVVDGGSLYWTYTYLEKIKYMSKSNKTDYYAFYIDFSAYTFSEDLVVDNSTLNDASKRVSNDVIYITCKDEENAKKIVLTAEGWTLTQWSNKVVLQKTSESES